MTGRPPPPATPALRRMTEARVALGRSGAAVPTVAAQRFALDHARAREAVWSGLDATGLAQQIQSLGPVAQVQSAVRDRADYLKRPDLGRKLAPDTDLDLDGQGGLVIVLADGLSATAVHMNAPGVLHALLPDLQRMDLAPRGMVIARQARVALGDAVAAAVGAEAVLVLIGERPGLSASDSLGAYLTWAPAPDLPNARRNCISNIRGGGLAPDDAARQIAGLLGDMRRVGISGVDMKARLAALPKG